MASLPIAVVLALAAFHVPQVAPETVLAFAQTESALNPLAIHDNTDDQAYAPGSLDGAIRLAYDLMREGHNLDLGLMQISNRNLSHLGLTVSNAFDPVLSIRAGAKVMVDSYRRCLSTAVGVAALKCMASYYNTGTPWRGLGNGYVARLWHVADQLVPPIRETRQIESPPSDAPPPLSGDGDFHDAVAVHPPRPSELKDHS